MSSGYRFPVPPYLILANIYIILRVFIHIKLSPRFRKIDKARKRAGMIGILPGVEVYPKRAHYLSPGSRHTEYLVEYVPENVTCCGPIVLISQSLWQADADLVAWLQRAPAILVNLGSHVAPQAKDALSLAQGLRIVLDLHKSLQVLWKLAEDGDTLDASIAETLTEDVGNGRVRIEDWRNPDPAAILESGHVVCPVHHGGANSYFEAVK